MRGPGGGDVKAATIEDGGRYQDVVFRDLDRSGRLQDATFVSCTFEGARVREAVGGDGVLIALPNVSRKSVAEVTDGLVPALQRRGLVRKAYEHAQFRDNLLAF